MELRETVFSPNVSKTMVSDLPQEERCRAVCCHPATAEGLAWPVLNSIS